MYLLQTLYLLLTQDKFNSVKQKLIFVRIRFAATDFRAFMSKLVLQFY